MSAIVSAPKVIYPESDGAPIAENTKQFRWIMTIEGGLETVFRHDDNVFVAGDLLWYPVEGNNKIRAAPDAMVVFGRPKGDRGSYLQWLENNIAPQVTFEVLSPGNRSAELIAKFKFYERYGVQEYYLWDPDEIELTGWVRSNGELVQIPEMNGWMSPLLNVRFDLVDDDLRLYGPDGTPFATYQELVDQRNQARQRADQAEQRAGQAEQRADQAQQRAERLAAQLQALGIEPANGNPGA